MYKIGKCCAYRGGTGFALLLLYDLAAIGSEVLLSALKYLANLLELSTGKDADSVGDTTQTRRLVDCSSSS